MNLARTQGMCDFPLLKDAKGIACFVGMINFYCWLIPRATELAVPLNELQKNNSKFIEKGNKRHLMPLRRQLCHLQFCVCQVLPKNTFYKRTLVQRRSGQSCLRMLMVQGSQLYLCLGP